MYNQTTSISSSYFPNTGLPQALYERSESVGSPISVHYNWPELENISINSVLLRTDSIGDFARNWYKSACAIVFQPYDSAFPGSRSSEGTDISFNHPCLETIDLRRSRQDDRNGS